MTSIFRRTGGLQVVRWSEAGVVKSENWTAAKITSAESSQGGGTLKLRASLLTGLAPSETAAYHS